MALTEAKDSDSSAATPLIVDLDETLVRTDTLHEALLRLVVSHPLALFGLFGAVRRGKSAFKSYVADRQVVPADALPFNADVLALINDARAQGRDVALVSASDHRQVSAVAAHLDLFDEAVGTGSTEADGKNLSGAHKAEYLAARYGAGQFDYVGDCDTDLPVWAASRTAYVTQGSRTLSARAAAQDIDLNVLGTQSPSNDRIKATFKAMRPHQWIKNILVFLPVLAAQDAGGLVQALLAFVFFSLIASSVYIINDLVDLPADRTHPRKCQRPFAAGTVPIRTGILLALVLLVGSTILSAILMPPVFLAVLALYFAITLAYSLVLKRGLIIDVVTLATLYTMRIIAGAAATYIEPSPWLVAFSMFLFFGLAAIKRQAELVDQIAHGKDTTPGRGYLSTDVTVLQMLAISSGQAAVLVFALYLYSPAVAALYDTPQIMWLICPIMLYWLSRVALLTHRGQMTDDPIIFAVRDRTSQFIGVVLILVLLAAERDWNL